MEGERGMERRFEFQAQDRETLDRTLMGTSKIRNIVGYMGDDGILCLGQLKTLFGEPLYVSPNLEDQYAYCILALDKDGKEVYLHVYSGPTGPAIGGKRDAESTAAADELAELITSAKASDYEYEGYYLDGPCVVRTGIRNGVPYSEEAEIPEEDFEKICEKVYGWNGK